MAITSTDVQLILAMVSQMQRESHVPLGEHGVGVSSSWSAVTDPASHGQISASTFQVTAGKTYAILGNSPENPNDDFDSGFAHQRVSVATMAIGDQYAPRGGERTVLLPTETSPIAVFIHGDDDTFRGLLPGERIISHFNGEPDLGGAVNVSLHLKNDGATTGDNLGGLAILAGALLSVLTTNGYGITVTDSSGAVVVSANTVQLAGSGTTAGNAVMNATLTQDALTAFKAAMMTAGVPNAGSITVPPVGSSVTAPPSTVVGSSKSFTA